MLQKKNEIDHSVDGINRNQQFWDRATTSQNPNIKFRNNVLPEVRTLLRLENLNLVSFLAILFLYLSLYTRQWMNSIRD